MTEFTWDITGMKRRASNGMVYQVDYKVVANRGDYKSSTNGYVRLRESSSPIAFASLTEDLVVSGDARVTGILTIGTGSITLDPNARRIKGIDEILIGADDKPVTIKKDDKGEIKFEDNDGKETSVGIGTTVSINTSGIITAATIKASTAFYPPLYSTSSRDAGTFTQGAIIFNTDTKKLEFYNGTSWSSLPGMSLGLTVALDG